ncbi:alcohol dehydrogenase catalytic domain-containing protein [Streptomyces chumphonensis]|uniref:2-deoxy-scyllo-inosamine dehydrogenase n=1 Tax=Streptomyces chumphonensis TaxID=1214925 RepID=A0A927EXI0_9ACTN|nr:alcohol dehydrogenase catalytic domain-containing protein [Streptomyces chumphonensis]
MPSVRTARAVVVDGPRAHRLVSGPVAEPAPGEVRVAVAAALVDPADRAVYEGRADGSPIHYPVTPGREWSGTVEAVGAGVTERLLGRAVAGRVEPGGCLVCARCREGSSHLCARPSGRSGPGAFADVLVLPAEHLHTLPDDSDRPTAALLGRAAVAAGAALAGAPVPGERVAVHGADTLGLLTVQLLAVSSPGELVVVDRRAHRLEQALGLGADRTVEPAESAVWHGRCDLVVETAGEPESAHGASLLARPGGRIVLAGRPGAGIRGPDPTRPASHALTVRAAPAAWTHAVRAFRLGRLRAEQLVSHAFPLADFGAAMSPSDGGRPRTGAVLLRP